MVRDVVEAGSEYYFALAAFCSPEIESVRHAIHPYMYWREMRRKDYRRIRAGVQAYLNAPVRRLDTCRVNYREPDKLEIWRRHCEGPLEGWYAAIALDRRAFVTYGPTEARVAASQERRVVVPMPPKAKVGKIEAVPHEGHPVEHPAERTQLDGKPAVRLWVPDGGDEVMYIRIGYELESASRGARTSSDIPDLL